MKTTYVEDYFELDGETYGLIGNSEFWDGDKWVEGVVYASKGKLYSQSLKDFNELKKKPSDVNRSHEGIKSRIDKRKFPLRVAGMY